MVLYVESVGDSACSAHIRLSVIPCKTFFFGGSADEHETQSCPAIDSRGIHGNGRDCRRTNACSGPFLPSTPAAAAAPQQPPPPPRQTPPAAAPAAAPAAPTWSVGPMDISGFIDGYYSINANRPTDSANGQINDLYNFNDKTDQFDTSVGAKRHAPHRHPIRVARNIRLQSMASANDFTAPLRARNASGLMLNQHRSPFTGAFFTQPRVLNSTSAKSSPLPELNSFSVQGQLKQLAPRLLPRAPSLLALSAGPRRAFGGRRTDHRRAGGHRLERRRQVQRRRQPWASPARSPSPSTRST